MTDATTFKSDNLKISANGAHVLSAATSLGELFYVSSASSFAEGAAIRGGNPIVAPWFATFLGELQHGWARVQQWEISEVDGGFHASLSNDGLVLGFDALNVNDSVTLRLTVENTTDESRMFQMAFHPYFAVSNVEEIAVRGLDGVDVSDRAKNAPVPNFTQEGDITFSGEVDRIYHASKTVEIVDAERVLSISAVGADSTIVWNPGAEKADTMADLGAGEFPGFVCVEPALLGADFTQGVQLSPGEITTLEMTVNVSARS
ncbi:aldose epimerase family protein [Corynebacterium uterequi]|uniref:glucose-6-phosphate 1-epimerase n=1 Tax=Corynebacterium uterequi TaxID=1072256 RepID=A0A0G3HFW1_9CORY|nr:aldose epimerase [Corynebacterium uterequi]AKK11610.1 aldose 1-epimerase-like enzyme [Corynebacterium uterequi]